MFGNFLRRCFDRLIQTLDFLLLCLQTELMMRCLLQRNVRCCVLLQDIVKVVDWLVEDLLIQVDSRTEVIVRSHISVAIANMTDR